MSFFFKKKKTSFDAKQPNEIKDAVTIHCPTCNNEQTEPSTVQSTNCKKCSTYIKIVDGKAIDNSAPLNPFGKVRSPETSTPKKAAPVESPVKEDPQSTEEPALDPSPSDTLKKDLQKDTPSRYVPPAPRVNPNQPAAHRSSSKKIAQREVSCFECDHSHQAPALASSTNCPGCGMYITLKDFEIQDIWNQRIQTRGNVTIYKKASVTGITIQCHNLLVNGKFTGGVNCSGDFTINSHSKIMGTVKCKRLIIEKKANVEFSNHVYAQEVIIDGSAIGHFTCTGKLQLKKKATITGDIKVATMTMEEGAKHTGRMSIGQ
ncbi:MAG: polymer-forming cytoskeletal protein [Akkermansiaceae bacterium]